MSPLLNYTTTIDVDKTLYEIQKLLAACGAKSIIADYDAGQAIALSFIVTTRFGEREFRLPADIGAIWRVMTRQYEQGKIPRRFITKEQAARVAWRINLDWLKAQMAIIESEMVSLEQVLLPYLLDNTGHTLYEAMVEQRLALPSLQE